MQQKTYPVVATCLFKQCYRHCSSTAIFLTLFYQICNNKNQLKVTLQFPLDKYTFN